MTLVFAQCCHELASSCHIVLATDPQTFRDCSLVRLLLLSKHISLMLCDFPHDCVHAKVLLIGGRCTSRGSANGCCNLGLRVHQPRACCRKGCCTGGASGLRGCPDGHRHCGEPLQCETWMYCQSIVTKLAQVLSDFDDTSELEGLCWILHHQCHQQFRWGSRQQKLYKIPGRRALSWPSALKCLD